MQTLEARSEPQGVVAVTVRQEALVPAAIEVIAADSQKAENGGSTDLQRASDVSGQRQQVPMPMLTPGTQSGAPPPQQPHVHRMPAPCHLPTRWSCGERASSGVSQPCGGRAKPSQMVSREETCSRSSDLRT